MEMMNGGGDQQPSRPDDGETVEAVGSAPGLVTYQVSVSASFALK